MLQEKVLKAIAVANKAHAKQLRKGTNIPYVVHPIEAMTIALKHTQDQDILVGCLLHDVLEDVPDEYSEDDMRRDFGDKIVEIVKGVSEDKSIKDWRERKELYVEGLKNDSRESAMVCASDKIANLGDIINDYHEVGDKLWDRFNSDNTDRLWFYESVLKTLEERGDIPEKMLNELRALVRELSTIV